MTSSIINAPVLFKVPFKDGTLVEPQVIEEKSEYVRTILWKVVINFSLLHLGALYGVYLSFTSAKFATVLFEISKWPPIQVVTAVDDA
ncbi:acyl-CoA Delta(11) desaturase [Solenopsis invicta]|uniref:acyl-CoA Delta(11) desaturase n=1 Tax=Solenopsis invicta TaxID=13686 RepID=UPI0005958C42|nr:acyl-CoA Delta(11) desaturase [Solenopsis invicta]